LSVTRRRTADGSRSTLPLLPRLGWRNLWRNGRRTALTAGGVAFAVFLVVTVMCIQLGSYVSMKDTATGLLTGHIQIQNVDYVEDERLESAVPRAGALAELLATRPGVAAVAPRVEAFALASADERSFGARILGVDPAAEARVVDFHQRIVAGRHIRSAGDAVLGESLARNLGAGLGDEVVLLGSASRGGVAALVVTVRGLFRTGVAEIDRSLLLAELGAVQEAFALADAAHTLVVRTNDLDAAATMAAELRETLPAQWPAADGVPLAVRPWSDLLPDLRQAIEIDRVSNALFYWLVMILVTFSVVNTFIMTVFERTREFGMMLAVGMRPFGIVGMLQWEAAFLWAIGTAVGLLLAVALVAWLSGVGIYLGADIERLASEMYMPTRLYPTFAVEALTTAPLVMFLATQLAAVLPSLRLRRLQPVTALRMAA
jgi:ABC-type lipoprotein release transport system permease subunit